MRLGENLEPLDRPLQLHRLLYRLDRLLQPHRPLYGLLPLRRLLYQPQVRGDLGLALAVGVRRGDPGGAYLFDDRPVDVGGPPGHGVD